MADSFLLFLPENITSIEFKASTWRIFVGVARVAIKVKKRLYWAELISSLLSRYLVA